MANPFLFDTPAAQPQVADNPFLSDAGGMAPAPAVAAAPAANPFLAGGEAPMVQPQAQPGLFGQPQMAPAAAANPFADFAAPAPSVPQQPPQLIDI